MTEITEIHSEAVTEKPIFRGKELTLHFTLWSLIQLQQVHGIKLSDLQGKEGEEAEVDFVELVKLISVGMIDEYPDVTYEDVAKAFGIGDMELLSKELSRAMSASNAMGKPAQSLGLA